MRFLVMVWKKKTFKNKCISGDKRIENQRQTFLIWNNIPMQNLASTFLNHFPVTPTPSPANKTSNDPPPTTTTKTPKIRKFKLICRGMEQIIHSFCYLAFSICFYQTIDLWDQRFSGMNNYFNYHQGITYNYNYTRYPSVRVTR